MDSSRPKYSTYELTVKTNHFLIQGGALSSAHKQNIVGQLLSAVSTKETALRFYKSVRFPNNIDREGRRMYPVFYIPPYNNGKKYPTVMNQPSKTHILSANSYELEVLRLLNIFSPEEENVKHMTVQTQKRLRTTCFAGRDCGLGECFETSLVTLRFLAAAAPGETWWMRERLDSFQKHFEEKHRHRGVMWYFWLCLGELPLEIAEAEILRCEEDMLKQVSKGFLIKDKAEEEFYSTVLCVIRNAVARLEKYKDLDGQKPSVEEKDGKQRVRIIF